MRKEVLARDVEDVIGNRIQALEGAFTEQRQFVETKIADIFEAIRLLTVNQALTSGGQGHGNQSPEIHFHDQNRHHRQGNQANYAGMSRLGRVDFPRFDDDCVKDWLFKVEEFFAIDNTPHELRVRLASIHYDKLAAAWHQSVAQSDVDAYVLEDWEQYKILLKGRFEEVLDDLIAELKRLHETYGIRNYHAKFELIRNRVKLSESYLVCAYLAGLNTDTQMHVRMFQPKSVRECLLLGRLYETTHPRKTSSTNWSISKGVTSNTSSSKGVLPYQKPFDQKKFLPLGNDKQKEVVRQPQKFLSNEEMSERRAKGLCYYCDEKYTPGHYLNHKKTQLYLLETDDTEEFFEADEEIGNEEEGDIAHI